MAVEFHEAIMPRISTCLATEQFVIVGGLGGELLVAPTGQTKGRWFCLVSHETDNVVTHISEHSKPDRCLVASNDNVLRVYTIDGLRLEQHFRMPWSINAASASKSGAMICVVGDSTEATILDARTGKEAMARLQGHVDFSFCCTWSHDDRLLVTGNQDHSARIYDCRYIQSKAEGGGAMKVLRGEMAAVRCVKFSPDGTCLAMMEADDYVHLYDASSDFAIRQTIDFFGETAGIGFTPDSEHFYIGISSLERGGLFEYRRQHSLVHDRFRSILL